MFPTPRSHRFVLSSLLLLSAVVPLTTSAQAPASPEKAKVQKRSVSILSAERLAALSSPLESLELTPAAEGKANAVFQAKSGDAAIAEARTRLKELNPKVGAGGRFAAQIAFDFE